MGVEVIRAALCATTTALHEARVIAVRTTVVNGTSGLPWHELTVAASMRVGVVRHRGLWRAEVGTMEHGTFAFFAHETIEATTVRFSVVACRATLAECWWGRGTGR